MLAYLYCVTAYSLRDCDYCPPAGICIGAPSTWMDLREGRCTCRRLMWLSAVSVCTFTCCIRCWLHFLVSQHAPIQHYCCRITDQILHRVSSDAESGVPTMEETLQGLLHCRHMQVVRRPAGPGKMHLAGWPAPGYPGSQYRWTPCDFVRGLLKPWTSYHKAWMERVGRLFALSPWSLLTICV